MTDSTEQLYPITVAARSFSKERCHRRQTIKVYDSVEEMKADELGRESTPSEQRLYQSYLEWLHIEKRRASELQRANQPRGEE